MKKITIMAALICLATAACAKDAGNTVSEVSENKTARPAGVNLRILDNNIWDYSKEVIPDAWKKLGVDCRDCVRGPQFAGMVTDYMPDVFGFQEYSSHMHAVLYPIVSEKGYRIAYQSGADWNNTPLFYNEKTITPLKVNYVLYSPAIWSNIGSKSFTSGVFQLKDGGQKFCVICTHLWWKSDKAQPGSTQARAAQIRLIMAEAEVILAEYGDIPVFIMGDMNCEENTIPMKQLLEGGYTPCYKVATEQTDLHNGHHVCSPSEGFSTESHRKGADRETGAIDHLLVRGNAEVKVFSCIMDEYTVKLTDHYPNLLDIKL